MNSSDPNLEYLRQQIATTPVLVYSWLSCPYCTTAKQTFAKLGVRPVVYELDNMPNGGTIKNHLKQLTGQSTVPNIFIGGKHVGGNSDLQDGLRNGSVQTKLREAGIQVS
jgi:glutaredoxin 3